MTKELCTHTNPSVSNGDEPLVKESVRVVLMGTCISDAVTRQISYLLTECGLKPKDILTGQIVLNSKPSNNSIQRLILDLYFKETT